MVHYTNTSSPWFATLLQTKEWLQEQEELRLQGERIDRPNTKWVFESTVFVDLKVILDRQPLQIGLGRLPHRLRNKREVISLDTFNDNLCVFRCLAVHQEADKHIIYQELENLPEASLPLILNLMVITMLSLYSSSICLKDTLSKELLLVV